MTMMMISVVVLMMALSLAPFLTAVYMIQQDTIAPPPAWQWWVSLKERVQSSTFRLLMLKNKLKLEL